MEGNGWQMQVRAWKGEKFDFVETAGNPFFTCSNSNFFIAEAKLLMVAFGL
jgi:hypothetical protein